jgi:hypothetical protein
MPRKGRIDWVVALSVATAVVLWTARCGYVARPFGQDRLAPDSPALQGGTIAGAHAVYLFSPGCLTCVEANAAIAELRATRPDLRIVAIDLSDAATWRSAEETRDALARAYGLGPLETSTVPLLFTPSQAIVGHEAAVAAAKWLAGGGGGAAHVRRAAAGRAPTAPPARITCRCLPSRPG